MQRNYVAKATVNFPDFGIYVRMGDILVFTPQGNNLTIYRGATIVKTIKATSLTIDAMVKTKILEEVVNPKTSAESLVEIPTVKNAPKPLKPKSLNRAEIVPIEVNNGN